MELYGVRRALSAKAPGQLNFDPDLATFTEGMAKRAGTVFAGAPIVQGNWDGSGTPDVLTFGRGVQISGHFYANFDPYQGGGFCVWTPEHSGSASRGGFDGYLWYALSYSLRYQYDDEQFRLRIGGQSFVINHTVTAGTPVYLAWGFDTNNKLDGTNYAYLSVNDAQTFGITVQPTVVTPTVTIKFGQDGNSNAADGIIEGLTFVREIPWTGAFGTDLNGGLDIVAYHAAGNDVCLALGSWGVTYALPTDASPGALA